MLHRLRQKLRKTGFAARLAVTFLTIILILFNLALIVGATRLFEERERSSRANLATGAALVASSINPDDLLFLELSTDNILGVTDFDALYQYQDWPSIESLRISLAKASLAYDESEYTISILSRDRYLILDKDNLYTEPTDPAWFEEDEELFLQALEGRTAVSEIEKPGRQSRRAYRPIYNATNFSNGSEPQIIGVIQAELIERVGITRSIIRRRSLLTLIISVTLIAFLWIFLNRIITRSTKLQAMNEQDDRLRALGGVTAGVAHEIRNPLGIIILILEEMQAILKHNITDKERDSLRELTYDVKQETKRLEDLTEQFLSFSRGHVKKQSDIRKLKAFRMMTEDTVKLFKKTIPPSLQLELKSDLEMEVTTLDENHWRQILLNLLQNAKDACKKNGKITITQNRESDQIITSIQDSGNGMDSATLKKVFDPFYTTKSEGTGLGLPLAKRMIEDVMGTINIESEPKKGTKITIILPIFKSRASSTGNNKALTTSKLDEPSDF